MPGQLQPLLSAWLDKQMSGFVVWVDRQLQQEDWKPLGLDQVRLLQHIVESQIPSLSLSACACGQVSLYGFLSARPRAVPVVDQCS
jgi:hypothetical protein